MPTDPTPAQREASRRNGARSSGPVSPRGRARIARAATRHGLFGTFRLLPGEDGRAFAALREGWAERLRPQGPAEAAALDRLVAVIWREGRLVAVEDRLLRAMAQGEPTEGLPALASILRYRARLERERRTAEEELARLRALRAVAAEVAAEAPVAAAATVEPARATEPIDGDAAMKAAATGEVRARVSTAQSAQGAVGHGPGTGREFDRCADRRPVGDGAVGAEERRGPLDGSVREPPQRQEAGPEPGFGGTPGGSAAPAGAERSATAPEAVRAVGAGRWGWRHDGAGAQAEAAELAALLDGIEERFERERAEAEPWAAVLPELLRTLAEGGGAARARAA